MSKSAADRVKAVVEMGRQIVDEAAPEVLSVTRIAIRIAEQLEHSLQVTRRDLRTGVASGEFVELRPNRGWGVHWTSADEARLTVRLVKEHVRDSDNKRTLVRHVLCADEKKHVGTQYGPGNTTYLITKEQADRFVAEVVAAAEAKEKAESEEYEAKKKAERKEIQRREPGFAKEIRRMRMLLNPVWMDRENRVSASACLYEPALKRGTLPVEEQELDFNLTASGTTVGIIRQILAKGLEAYRDSLPVTRCRYCKDRIFYLEQGEHSFWWHWDTVGVPCEGGETKASPEHEAGK